MVARIAICFLLVSGMLGSEERMPGPRYTAQNELVRPEGYREWMFVGSSLGMGYAEGQAPSGNATFHNIYLQREAYSHFAKTGKFPDKTILVMEVLAPGKDVSINKRGQFSDRFIGIEVALKDETRYAEKWAYFDFIGRGGKGPLASAKPFAKDRCWSCHNEHGKVDNVFVQFYPVLRAVQPAR
ncbi:MAG: cytochrome P460 family protein [Bryobacteraceae bacterium]